MQKINLSIWNARIIKFLYEQVIQNNKIKSYTIRNIMKIKIVQINFIVADFFFFLVSQKEQTNWLIKNVCRYDSTFITRENKTNFHE